MNNEIIDIGRYLGRVPHGEKEPAFSVWGGEGDRARLALPVWRAIFLVGGDWGGVVSLSSQEGEVPRPYFILDLAEEPARTTAPDAALLRVRDQKAPALAAAPPGEVAVLLGEDGGARWFLQVSGVDPKASLNGRRRESLLFLAGECAGLLFLKEG